MCARARVCVRACALFCTRACIYIICIRMHALLYMDISNLCMRECNCMSYAHTPSPSSVGSSAFSSWCLYVGVGVRVRFSAHDQMRNENDGCDG